ncbi:MAG: M28 family metallopeptidase [Bacteroidia bacterium]
MNIFLNFFLRIAIIVVAVSLLASCGSKPSDDNPTSTLPAVDTMYMASVVEEIASDEYQGRRPFTEGETKTVSYLVNQVKTLGLAPGNGDSYTQEVPLVEIESSANKEIAVKGFGTTIDLGLIKDYVAQCPRTQEYVSIANAELVFCGYGIVAPEYNWNDYEGVNMEGKIAVVMVNDPGYATGDSTFFKGKTMTYYGRWTYKFEEAARQGAAGVLVIHETGAAGYPWFVVQRSGTGKRLYLQTPNGNTDRCAMQGWLSLDAAARLIKASSNTAGQQILRKASEPGFKAIPMGLKTSMAITNKIRRNTSQNVVAMRAGSKHPDEYIIYTAHWDHLGIGAVVDGDSIYNGAMDNASGTACVLSLAKAFSEMTVAPTRSVVFLFVTAEEQGLLGAAYYASNPIFPLNQTVANLNMDGMNINGPMNDVTVYGYGQSELEDLLKVEAAVQGRYVQAEQEPEKGLYFRSDHFCFAKVGVPALNAKGGYDHKTRGKEYAQARRDDYTANHYHRPSDEYSRETWNFQGMQQDAELYLGLGYRLAQSNAWPAWRDGSEFKKARNR